MTDGLFSENELHENEQNSKIKITQVRQVKKGGPIVKNVIPDEVTYVFTCKKCGNHSYNDMPTNQSKWGGAGLSANTIRVCKNCNTAESEFPNQHQQ